MNKIENPILVTGTAGFIGFHTARYLLEAGYEVVGVDNFVPYYDVRLKEARQNILNEYSNHRFFRLDLADTNVVNNLFDRFSFKHIIHLAAQPGVRYSLENPSAYLTANFAGFFNILEACRHFSVDHLIYASSSSVYGLNTRMPFTVQDNVDHPISLYAASKKSNELMAHSYSHLYRLPTTGLRFFTVYGPWGRPDMAPFKFCRAIFEGKTIQLYNYGNMQRDFTYIDDIVEGIVGVLNNPAEPDFEWNGDTPSPASSPAPYRVYNIGAGSPVQLGRFLELIETNMGKTTNVEKIEIQPGDVEATFADVTDLSRDTGYQPKIQIEEGIKSFAEWFLDYYGSGRELPDYYG
ncbi:NAD-dependent epimerase [bacterium]|nr:NAD-dependent epimerase [bacterium]